MALSIADQIALDDALVAPADRLKIGKCNLRLSSDVTSKEATLQVVYDVLKLTPFYKAFQLSVMFQKNLYAGILGFWLMFTNRSVRFKRLTRKPSTSPEAIPGIFFKFSLKSDFTFKIENKNTKKGSAMYYPRFTKIVVNYVMEKDPSIPRRNKVNWHYARGLTVFTTINVIQGMKDSVRDDQDDEQIKMMTAENDDDEELTESDNDGDDFVHPKLTTHDDEIIHEEDSDEDKASISSSDDEDSDDEDEGTNVDGAKTQKEMGSDTGSGNEEINRSHRILYHHSTTTTTIIDTGNYYKSLLQNLPNFASLFGFDHRLKALEDNFSEFRQTNQYAEALSSIPSTIDQYLAHKMQRKEAVDVAKIIKEQVKRESPEIIPKVEKLVTDQLESEVLVRSSKEANTSHAVAANLSELELKKILIDKMEANNSINRTKTTSTGSKTHKKSASQSAPVGEAMHSTDIFKGSCQPGSFETGVQDEHVRRRWFNIFLDGFKNQRDYSHDHAWNTRSTKPQRGNWTGSTLKVANILMICDSHYRNQLGTSIQKSTDNCLSQRLKLFEWHDYKHLTGLQLRRDDEEVTNLSVEDRIAFNVPYECLHEELSLQRRVGDLQTGVDGHLDDVRTVYLNDRLKWKLEWRSLARDLLEPTEGKRESHDPVRLTMRLKKGG
ncbi:hypothetical protein Tco_0530928 [Tanacetum coccineum]